VREPLFTETHQIAIVVRDLEAALRTYVDDYGIGPWKIYEFNAATADAMILDDEPGEYAMRVAITKVGSVEWELIEPLDNESSYAKFLAERGEGVHHVSMGVRSYDEAMKALRTLGRTVRQGGGYKGARFSYMSTDEDLRVITEIVDWPAGTNHPPDSVYPPEADDD
jgi:catechol 2,3-dioxygenase-like lactoylglutathione lyase family enzyme